MSLSHKNLIVIVADTLRKDYLGCYGNKSIRTPNLDKFAKKCTIFENYYSASFPTVPYRADLYTGKYTFTYLGWAPMPVDEVILPEVLKNAGYTTLGAVDTPFYIRWGHHFDRGFDVFVETYGQSRFEKNKGREYTKYGWVYEEDYFSPQTFINAEHLLEQHYDGEKPFFLLVDTWDPHEPWDPPEWYAKLYKPDYDGRIVDPPYKRVADVNVTKEDLETAHACYCGEITMVDEWVGRFLRKIDNMQLMDDTVIVFTSDHGFCFGEHGIFGKGITKEQPDCDPKNAAWLRSPLYEEVIRIPLLVYHPDEDPKRFEGLASAVDLMPTILDLVEVQKPKTIQGKTMIQAIRNKSTEGRNFVVSSFPLYNPGDVTKIVDAFERMITEFLPCTITTPEWSLIYSAKTEKVELYNLKKDSIQENNIVEDHPDIARELYREYFNLLKICKVDARLLEPRKGINI